MTSLTPRPGPYKKSQNSRLKRPESASARALQRLGLVPQGVHLRQVGGFRGAALLGQARLDMAEAADELGVRAPQRRFRLDLQLARQVGAHEQQVAQLLAGLGDVAGGDLGLEL